MTNTMSNTHRMTITSDLAMTQTKRQSRVSRQAGVEQVEAGEKQEWSRWRLGNQLSGM